MKRATIDKLKKDSSFYGDGFKYVVKKVYKHNNKVSGVEAFCTWSNEYGNFCSAIQYISSKELLSLGCNGDDYDDEFVQI